MPAKLHRSLKPSSIHPVAAVLECFLCLLRTLQDVRAVYTLVAPSLQAAGATGFRILPYAYQFEMDGMGVDLLVSRGPVWPRIVVIWSQ